jgi:hypothetical protein
VARPGCQVCGAGEGGSRPGKKVAGDDHLPARLGVRHRVAGSPVEKPGRLTRLSRADRSRPVPADWWRVYGRPVCPTCWHRRLGELERLRRELEDLSRWIASGNHAKLAGLIEAGRLPAAVMLERCTPDEMGGGAHGDT